MSQITCKPCKILTPGDTEKNQDYYEPGKRSSKHISKLNKTKPEKSFSFKTRFMKYFPEVCMIIRKVTQTVEKSRKLVCFPGLILHFTSL